MASEGQDGGRIFGGAPEFHLGVAMDAGGDGWENCSHRKTLFLRILFKVWVADWGEILKRELMVMVGLLRGEIWVES